jgi:hypothetical protein
MGIAAIIGCKMIPNKEPERSGVKGIHQGWHMRMQGNQRSICWDGISLQDSFVAEARRVFREDISAKTSFKFNDVGACPGNLDTRQITPIRFVSMNIRPHVAMSVSDNAVISFLYLSHEYCGTVAGTQRLNTNQLNCIRATILHEGGHLMGLDHEITRPDAPRNCGDDFRVTGATAVSIGEYDPKSVMNYCHEVDSDPRFSTGDIIAIETLYSGVWLNSALVREGNQREVCEQVAAQESLRGAVLGDKAWREGYFATPADFDHNDFTPVNNRYDVNLDVERGDLTHSANVGTGGGDLGVSRSEDRIKVTVTDKQSGKTEITYYARVNGIDNTTITIDPYAWMNGIFFQNAGKAEVYMVWNNMVCKVTNEDHMHALGGFSLVNVIDASFPIKRGRTFTGNCGWPSGLYRRANENEVFYLYGNEDLCHVPSEAELNHLGGQASVRTVPAGAGIEVDPSKRLSPVLETQSDVS